MWEKVGAPCYLIMFFMGILDIPALTIFGVFGGWWQMHGDEFCSSPHLFYIAGTVYLGKFMQIYLFTYFVVLGIGNKPRVQCSTLGALSMP